MTRKNGFSYSGKDVARAAIAPQLNMSFQGVAWCYGVLVQGLAVIFAMTGLLPRDHAALRHSEIGQWGVFYILREARQNLVWNSKNIPQIAIYIGVWISLCSTVIMLGLVFSKFLFGVAHASSQMLGANISGDMLGMSGDNTGTPNVYEHSAARILATDANNPVLALLGPALKIYSTTMLIIAGIVVVYMIMKAVGETAQSGVPFGKSFNHIWAPIRLVLAIALLVPVTNVGLNAGQVIVMKFAEWGSDVGTRTFVAIMGNTANNAISQVKQSQKSNVSGLFTDHIGSYLDQMLAIHMCAAFRAANAHYAQGAAVGNFNFSDAEISRYYALQTKSNTVSSLVANSGNSGRYVNMMLVGAANPDTVSPYNTTNNNRDWVVRVHSYVPIRQTLTPGDCGSFEQLVFGNPAGRTTSTAIIEGDSRFVYGMFMDQRVRNLAYGIIRDMVFDSTSGGLVVKLSPNLISQDQIQNLVSGRKPFYNQLKQNLVGEFIANRKATADIFTQEMATVLRQQVQRMGWVSAGMWLNTVAQLNGEFQEASANVQRAPQNGLNTGTDDAALGTLMVSLGLVAIKSTKENASSILETKTKATSCTIATRSQCEETERLAAAVRSAPDATGAAEGAVRLYAAQRSLDQRDLDRYSMIAGSPDQTMESIARTSMLSALFRSYFLKDDGTSIDNPLMQIHNLGRFSFRLGGVILKVSNPADTNEFKQSQTVFDAIGQTQGLGGYAAAVGFVLISVGFIAGFLLPMIPLIRFTIGILGWLLLLFEAVLAMPLVAIAHLRTDGEGLPGPMAQTAYIMAIGLFLRPLLMVCGLFLGLVLANLLLGFINVAFVPAIIGSGVRWSVNLFETAAYLMVYTMFAFTIVNASFKAIDLLPNNVMRWIGGSMSNDVGAEADSVRWQSESQFGTFFRGAAGSGGGAAGGGAVGLARMDGRPGYSSSGAMQPAAPPAAQASQQAGQSGSAPTPLANIDTSFSPHLGNRS